MSYDAIQAETVTIGGHDGDRIEAYQARPLGPGPFGAVVVIHHLPGYDRESKETVRRFAAEGYLAVCPNLYSRQGAGMSHEEAAKLVRARDGGISDEQLIGDVTGAAAYLREQTSSNGKVGCIGFCSGGRQAFLAAANVDLDAAVDCYGAFVVGNPPADAPLRARGILDQAPNLRCPLLGLFGNDDQFPSPDEVATLEKELSRLGKPHEFHSYDGAGHAFFSVDRPMYRPEAALDGWSKILDFYGRNLN
ncbi:carboxymethylenebutenolidase [Actinocatenispora thailandica]|uniref:Carboxymethylenebutenolidase n=1 Tax=Actinocatenispora thailandica TaxID=227318 RepID=A0A7R7DQ83_9ACTN|nr:dienelactone hydrolase family protein [Actinocatenispora thailandica]BCJ35905.1 carboxymethylenebutenolidase [Actinocatenispora thailandica]